MIKGFDELVGMLRAKPVARRVAVVSAADRNTLEAVMRARAEGFVEPVLIGSREKVCELLDRLGAYDGRLRIEDIADPAACAERAAALVRAGEADCIMKGAIETGALMRVLVDRERGIRSGGVMSLTGFMESPHYHKLFAITDIGLLMRPSLKQKRAAIENAVAAFHALGIERPKVAVLAALERVNPKMPETVDAAKLKEAGIDGAIVEGPISYDLAMDPRAAALKGYESPVAGDTDLLVVPDIVSGNIASKTITVLGGGCIGGTVLGARVPVSVSSRSAPADDKYRSIVVSALVGGEATF